MDERHSATPGQVWATGVASATLGAIITAVLYGGSPAGNWSIGWEAVSAVGTCVAAFAVIGIWTSDRRAKLRREENQAKIQVHLALPKLSALRRDLEALQEMVSPEQLDDVGMVDEFALLDKPWRDTLRMLAISPASSLPGLMTADLSGLPESVGSALVDAFNGVYALKNAANELPPGDAFPTEEQVYASMGHLRFAVLRALRMLEEAHVLAEWFVSERLGD